MANTITEGHLAILYISGANATLTGEPMANLDPATHLIYQITAPTKRVIDPTYAITPKGGYAGTFTSNRLTGTLTFSTSNAATEPMTMSGKYLPMAAMLYAKDFSLSIKPKLVDTTTIDCTTPPSYVSKKRVISGPFSGTIGNFFTPDDPTASLAITEYFASHLDADTVFALKFYVSANYELLAWVHVDTEAIKASIGNVLEETVSFSGYPDADNRISSQV